MYSTFSFFVQIYENSVKYYWRDGMNKRTRNIIYIDKKIYILAIFISTIFIIGNNFLYKKKYINESLDFLIYITISVGVIGLVSIIYKIVKLKSIKILLFTYSNLCINSFARLVEVVCNDIDLVSFESYTVFISNILYIMSMFFYYMGKNYTDDEDIVKSMAIWWSIYIALNYIFAHISEDGFILCINMLTLFVIVRAWKYYKGNRLFVKRFINSSAISFGIIIFSCICNIITLLFLNEIEEYVRLFLKTLLFIMILVETLKILEGMILKPYKIIFKELYKNNREMLKVNNEIEKNNVDLEMSKANMNRNRKVIEGFFRDIPMSFVIIDKDTERVLYTNKNFLKLIGDVKLEEIISKKIFSIVDVGWSENLINSGLLIEGEIVRDNLHKYVEIEVFMDEENNEEVILFFFDVTEKVKNFKLQQRIKNKELEENIKRDFLSNISHDLKTPINVIYSATQLMEVYRENGNYEGIEKYNSICKTNCFSLIRFTDNIIDSSKIKSDFIKPKLEVKNIVEVVEEVVISIVEYAKHKNIDIIFDTEEEEIYTYIDVSFIERITLNIISNSIKYCKDNGRIMVSINSLESDVKITFEDNGIGMDEKLLRSIFDRYYMGENNKETNEKGTGIGLFVVKRLIDEQNGKIRVWSEINKGTKFELVFKKGTLNEKSEE